MNDTTASRSPRYPCVSEGRRTLLWVVLLWLASLGAALPAAAQEPQQPQQTPDAQAEEPAADAEEERLPPPGEELPLPDGVEVIYVQGETLQAIESEVTSSVTQFDAEALKAIGAQNIADLAKVTPNLEIKTAGATAPTFFIRGVGLSDFAANAAGAVAIYQDDVPRNAPAIQLGTIFDVENVVVLRGPQGAGSGRNASAGAIKMYSRKPTGELGAYLQSTFGNFGYQDYEGAIETPIVDEILSSRLAFRLSERDPIADNRCDQVQDNLGIFGLPEPPAELVGRRVPSLQSRVDNPALWNNVSVCGESRFASYANNPQGPPSSFGPFPGGENISALRGGLPSGVNDLGNWAARGTARLQPPDTDIDLLLNLHGGRRDELSTLGQAVGTVQDQFGNSVSHGGGYRDRDILAMQAELEEENGIAPGTGLQDPDVRGELGRKLARNLDKHPYRGDYNRVGDTTLDTWGTFADGTWDLGALELRSVTGYDTYDRFRDTDQDFSPEVLFESIQEDDAWQFTEDLGAHGEITDTNLRWNAGGFYLMEHLTSIEATSSLAPPTSPTPLSS